MKEKGQTIRTPQLPHSETVDIQRFQKLYLVNFNCNENVLDYLIFAAQKSSSCGKNKRKIRVTGQTMRTPRLLHFQSLMYQRFQTLLFLLFSNKQKEFFIYD